MMRLVQNVFIDDSFNGVREEGWPRDTDLPHLADLERRIREYIAAFNESTVTPKLLRSVQDGVEGILRHAQRMCVIPGLSIYLWCLIERDDEAKKVVVKLHSKLGKAMILARRRGYK